MPPESGPRPDSRVRVNIPETSIPNPGELRVSDSLVRSEAPAEHPRRFSSTMDTPAEAGTEATVEDPAIRNEILGGDANYALAERDGRIYAAAGSKEADVTDLFAAGSTIDRYHSERPGDPTSPYKLTESVTVGRLDRVQTGAQKGKLRAHTTRADGKPLVIGIDEIGWSDTERRRWRLPAPAETRR